MNNVSKSLWIIGAGQMAQDYAKCLNFMKVDYSVIGRGNKSAKIFKKKLNIPIFTGGLEKNLKKHKIPLTAIVAVGVQDLKKITEILIKKGIKKILLEKPGGVNYREIKNLYSLAKKKKCKIYIAYNRRFYSSVLKLKKLLNKNNKILNIYFDFSEWSHIIKKINKDKKVKSHWLLANSSHVIDLAFYLSGKPNHKKFFSRGKLDWHKSSSSFCGAGVTKKNIIFSYNSDWISPGRWGIDVMTKKYRYILRPIEKLKYVEKGSIEMKDIYMDDKFDMIFKPGLFLQLKNFLNGNFKELCSLREQVDNMKIYSEIAGYKI